MSKGSKKPRRRWIAITLGTVVWCGLVGGALGFWYSRLGVNQVLVRQRETLVEPAVYQAAARQMATLCQSNPEWFRDETDQLPAWTPVELLKLKPSWVLIRPFSGKMEFGDGKYHLSYELIKDEDNTTPTENHWILALQSEDQPVKILEQFTTSPEIKADEAPFVENALQEYDRRIQKTAGAYRACDARSRAEFLMRHGRLDLLHEIADRDAKRFDYDWVDQLLVYVWSNHNEAANARLENWVSTDGNFTRYMYAAYVYEALGETDRANTAIAAAMRSPIVDSADTESIVPHCGLAMSMQLFYTGRTREAVQLCDLLLSYKQRNPLVNEIRQVRAAATFPLPFRKRDPFTNIIEDQRFNPLKGLDLKMLAMAQ